jgi:hypothetical protein
VGFPVVLLMKANVNSIYALLCKKLPIQIIALTACSASATVLSELKPLTFNTRSVNKSLFCCKGAWFLIHFILVVLIIV